MIFIWCQKIQWLLIGSYFFYFFFIIYCQYPLDLKLLFHVVFLFKNSIFPSCIFFFHNTKNIHQTWKHHIFFKKKKFSDNFCFCSFKLFSFKSMLKLTITWNRINDKLISIYLKPVFKHEIHVTSRIVTDSRAEL